MWYVEELASPQARSAACKALTESLPDWFGQPQANANYIAGVAAQDAFVVRDEDGDPIGLLSLRFFFDTNADIYWLGVAPDYHHQGIGAALVEAAATKAVEQGCQTLTVETLGPSDPDEGYARTRAFYRAQGFLPLFELRPHGPDTPLLYLVKMIQSESQEA